MRFSAHCLVAGLVTAFGGAGLPTPAAGQFPPEVRGLVVAGDTGAPVPGARVRLAQGGLEAVTEPDGSFVLRGVPPGAGELRIRAFGYREGRASFQAANGRVSRVRIRLSPAAIPIPGVGVTVEASLPPGARVVDRGEIRSSGARDLAGLLETVPGLTVTRRGGPGSPTTLSIRGSSPDEVLVLLDGAPINSPLTGEADLSTLPPDGVERILVLPGARTARWGPRALAGVVAIQTRRPEGTEVTVEGGVGAFGERTAGLSASASGEPGSPLSGTLSARWRALDGDFEYEVPRVRGGGRAQRRNADAELRSLRGSGTLEVRGLRMAGSLDVTDVERGMPGSVVQPSPGARQTQRRWTGTVALEALDERIPEGPGGVLPDTFAGLIPRGSRPASPGRRWGWRISLDATRHEARYRDPTPPSGPPLDERTEAGALGLRVAVNHPLGPLDLEGGIEGRILDVEATGLGPGVPGTPRTAGGWLLGDLRAESWSGWTLSVRPGTRVDVGSLLEGPELSPRLSLALTGASLTVTLSTGRSFSPPSLADQFFQEGVLVEPNPDLEPERVRGEVELGIEGRGAVAGLGLEGGVRAFRADVDGMILWFPDFRFVWSPRNVDVRRRGLEVSGRIEAVGRRLSLDGGLALVRTDYRRGPLEGPVVYRPTVTGHGELRLAVLGLDSRWTVRYTGNRRTVPGSPANALPGYWTLDAALRRSFRLAGAPAEIRVSADNLFDAGASMLADYPLPGRAWALQVRLTPTAAP